MFYYPELKGKKKLVFYFGYLKLTLKYCEKLLKRTKKSCRVLHHDSLLRSRASEKALFRSFLHITNCTKNHTLKESIQILKTGECH